LPTTIELYPDPMRLNQYLSEIRTAVAAVPGVRETAYSCAPPLQGSCYGMPMQPANKPMVDLANRSGGFFKVVSPSYFPALGIKMQKGRALSDRDTWNAPRALVMNERLAKRYFDKEIPSVNAFSFRRSSPGKTELGPGRVLGSRGRHRRREDWRSGRRSQRRCLRLERAESGPTAWC
jgi:hypothetical protein